MREITGPLSSFPWPYLFYKVREPRQRKLSRVQQRILDSMQIGIWYEPEKEWNKSLHALVRNGWCVRARVARRHSSGKLYHPDATELLLACIMGENLKNQPLEVYRRIVAE